MPDRRDSHNLLSYGTAVSKDRELRYGVLIDQPHLAGWHQHCLDRLRSVPSTQLVLLVVADVEPNVDSSQPLAIRTVRAKTTAEGRTRVLDRDSDATIADANIDFLLVLSGDVIQGNFISALRYGGWAFNFTNATGPPDAAFWAMCDGKTTLKARLERLCIDTQRTIILRRGMFGVHPHSVAVTERQVDMMTSHWPAQVCIDILGGIGAYVDGPTIERDNWERRRITAAASLRVRLRSATGRAVRIRENLIRTPDWNVGIVRSTPVQVATSGRLPTIEWLPSRPGTYLADPFAFELSGRRYVLCEEYNHLTRRGAISILEVDAQGRWTAPKRVIVAPHHFSYPFLLEDGGRIYCVPETFEARKVSLYVADPFPTTWREDAVLIDDFAGVDNTLVRHDGRWWLFSTNHDESDNSSLWVFHAPQLHGPWRPHDNNPVKTDVTSSRPAGPFFRQGTELYRPAQDCSDRYGARIVFHRVTTLSSRQFHEEVVAVVDPDQAGPYPSGFHTIAGGPDWSVVDGERFAFSSAAIRSAAYRYAAMAPRRFASFVRRQLSM